MLQLNSNYAIPGVVSLPFLVLTELSPIKIKDIIYSISLSVSWILAYLALQVIIVDSFFLLPRQHQIYLSF